MQKTNWDEYYKKPYKTAHFTRNITGNTLIKFMKKYSGKTGNFTISELGGANSCFYESIVKKLSPSEYYIYDNNETGLEAFRKRISNRSNVKLHKADLLNKVSNVNRTDIVFSVGLIEHFNQEGTKKVIGAHFDFVKTGGIIIITFPTPTYLYKSTRFISEMLGLWIFHDERPLHLDEVSQNLKTKGEILKQKIIWPIFLTQGVMVIKT